MVQVVLPQFKPFFEVFPGLDELIHMYEYISVTIERFKIETGITCSAFCSRCCDTSANNIETSIFEVLPVIIYLNQSQKIEQTLDTLLAFDENSHCIFYTPDILHAGMGNCSIYQWRPLICRLFGYMWIMDKQNRLVFSGCKVMKQQLDNFTNIASRLQESVNKLFAADFAYQCYTLTPHLASDRYSINTAILKGIQMFMLRVDYQALEKIVLETPPDNPDDVPPKFPPVKKCA